MPARQIIHIDMDAFYASVEILDNPGWRDKPVIVGGSSLRGVVCAASYAARKFGIHSGQALTMARQRCPQGIFLPVRMNRYREISDRVFAIFARFTPLLEPLSLDEAFLDVTDCQALFGSAGDMARNIKRLIVAETGLTASAGVGPNKLVAKIASDLRKPDGLCIVPAEEALEFLSPLPIARLWGVGAKTREALKLLGVVTVADLRRLPEDLLSRKFGVMGQQLRLFAQGIDERPVEPEREAKSIGRETTFDQDIVCPRAARQQLLALALEVARRLRRHQARAASVTLKVTYHDFRKVSRSQTLARATDDGHEIHESCCHLLAKTEIGRSPVRLLGISVSRLAPAAATTQLSLFPEPDRPRRQRDLNRALDTIATKFGSNTVLPASLLGNSGKS